jgi:hypothetical protein
MTTDDRLDQLMDKVEKTNVTVGKILERQGIIKDKMESLETRVSTVEKFAHRAAGALTCLVVIWPFVAPYISGAVTK